MPDRFDVVVAGAGMIGSAAAKYLAADGLKTLLIGPEEGNEAGIHGSHYDEARITRYSGPDLVWSQLAALSMERFESIENDSSMRFHRSCGHLRCDLPVGHPASRYDDVRRVLDQMPVSAPEVSLAELSARFPYLRFADESVFHLEPGPAGIINPRLLVRAQIAIGKRHGMSVLRDVVHTITSDSGLFEIHTSSEIVRASHVLVAAGSYTHLMHLLPVMPTFEVRPETVLLVRVDEELAGEWADMPGVIWNFDGHPEVPYAYVLPPVRYNDSCWYIKIGADHDKDVEADSITTFDAYMQSEGSPRTARLLYDLIQGLIPGLRGAPWRSKPCMLTYTAHGYPYIDEVSNNWFVAAGGCGKSAKSSDEIGRLASCMIQRKSWPQAFDRSLFSVSSISPERRPSL